MATITHTHVCPNCGEFWDCTNSLSQCKDARRECLDCFQLAMEAHDPGDYPSKEGGGKEDDRRKG